MFNILRFVTIVVVAALTFSVHAAPKAAKAQVPPAFVETIVVQSSSVEDAVEAVGTMLSIPGITIKSEIAGRVTKTYLHSGAFVKTGDKLLEINSDILKAQLISARAQAKLAYLNFVRMNKLYRNRDIAKADFDQVKASYDSALAEVRRLEASVAQANIVAPFAGKLGLSKISLGDYVVSGQEIVTLQTIDPLKIDFSISEALQGRVAVGMPVILTANSYPDRSFTGVVEAVEATIDVNNRTLKVRANVANPEHLLIPGGYANVKLVFANKQMLRVPHTAISYAEDGVYVFRLLHDTAVKTKVRVGTKDKDSIEVIEGLQVGDVVLVTGQSKIMPGAKIIDVSGKYTVSKA